MFAVADAQKKLLKVPDSINTIDINPVFLEMKQCGLDISGYIPINTSLELEKTLWDIPNRQTNLRHLSAQLSTNTSDYIDIEISPIGFSLATPDEIDILKSSGLFPDKNLWYFYNYEISIRTVITVFSFSRLTNRMLGKVNRKEYLYHWMTELIEGIERDFAWPIPAAEQRSDWEITSK